jgi:hypothetical protein
MKTTSGSVTDYCGNFIYADNQLITTFAGDVRIAPVNFGNSTYWKYEYSMKDHLGNTRVIFAAHSYGQPELLQQTSYYPFGMTMQQQNFYSQNTTKNKYLYNSKELQDDQLVGNTCYLPNKGTEFSHLSWPRGVYGDVPGDGEEFMGGGSRTPFLEYRKKNKKVVEKKVEQGDFNNFDLFDFYVSSFETPGMSFNVQIHPDIDGEETEEKKKPAGGGGDWINTAIDHTGKTIGGASVVNGGVKIVAKEYVSQVDINNKLAGIKNAKLPNAYNTAKGFSKKLGVVGCVIVAADVAYNSQVNTSDLISATMTGIAFTGWGAPIAGLWFVADFGTGLITGTSISDRIDSWVGTPLLDWDY